MLEQALTECNVIESKVYPHIKRPLMKLQLWHLQLKIHSGYHLIKSGGAVTTKTPSCVRTRWTQMTNDMHTALCFSLPNDAWIKALQGNDH